MCRILVRACCRENAKIREEKMLSGRDHVSRSVSPNTKGTAYEPRGFVLILFVIRMIRILGWRMSREFVRVLSEKPERKGRQLELMLLGTRTDCQQGGLGRAIIRHILDFARDAGYPSVVLEVIKDSPAFGFYLREGFVVDKEVAMSGISSLCFLRCPLAEEGERDE